MASRPSTARKVTPKTEAKRVEELDASISIRVDGTVYTVHPADITGLIEHKFRRQTEFPVMGLLSELSENSGIDSIAAFVFLAKLQAGIESTFLGELEAIDYRTSVEDGDLEPAPAPEA